MNKQEIARLVASLTDDEIEQLRDFLDGAETVEESGAHADSTGQFVKTVLRGRNERAR